MYFETNNLHNFSQTQLLQKYGIDYDTSRSVQTSPSVSVTQELKSLKSRGETIYGCGDCQTGKKRFCDIFQKPPKIPLSQRQSLGLSIHHIINSQAKSW